MAAICQRFNVLHFGIRVVYHLFMFTHEVTNLVQYLPLLQYLKLD